MKYIIGAEEVGSTKLLNGTWLFNGSEKFDAGFTAEDDSSLLIVDNHLENVYINTAKISLKEDNSEYLKINSTKRNYSFTFNTPVPLDTNTVIVKTINSNTYLYQKSTNKKASIIEDERISNVVFKQETPNTFSLNFVLEDITADELNEDGLKIYVIDVSGTGFSIELEDKWKDLNFDEDEIDKLIIKVNNITPSDRVLKSNIEGKYDVTIINPNEDLIFLNSNGEPNIKFGILENTLGVIDEASIDYSEYLTKGVIRLKVFGIKTKGTSTIYAYVNLEDENENALYKNKTYAEESVNNWILMDEEGRVYHIEYAIPTMYKDTKFGDFLLFAEKYLNTLYTDLKDEKNISILEKVARINDFNDIKKLEADYIYHYAKAHGCEIDIKYEDIKTIKNNDTYEITSSDDSLHMADITEESEDDIGILKNIIFPNDENVDTILKSILDKTPFLNSIKGTELSILTILRMFGLSCVLTNLYIKKSNPIDVEPNFISENSIDDYINYFMTDRFSVSIDERYTKCISYDDFSNTFMIFANIIKSVKSIEKILNDISYNVIQKSDAYLQFSKTVKEVSNVGVEEKYIAWTSDEFIKPYTDEYKNTYRLKLSYKCAPKLDSVKPFNTTWLYNEILYVLDNLKDYLILIINDKQFKISLNEINMTFFDTYFTIDILNANKQNELYSLFKKDNNVIVLVFKD